MKALIKAKIYPVSSEVIEKGTIIIDKGKIAAIGPSSEISTATCEVIDCSDLIITPGLIDAHTHISVMGEPATRPGLSPDSNEMSDPITPQLRAEDAIYPFDPAIKKVREAGFTTVFITPGSANLIGGTGCAIKLSGTTIDEMLIPGTQAMKFAFGENPKRVYGQFKEKAPVTRMASYAMLRETLLRAKLYSEQEKIDYKNYDPKYEALIPLMQGKMKARIHCHRADDIWSAIKLAKEFSFDFCLEHVTEGHLIVDKLADLRPKCVIGPMDIGPEKQELWNLIPDNAAILHKAKIPCSLTADAASATARLPQEAGRLIKYGLDSKDILEMITLTPAKFLGIESRTGSLEVGKDADFAVFTEFPLLNISKCVKTYINGILVHG